MSEVLFEITKDHLETGMRGFPVGYCTTSSVDAIKGLSYIGIPVPQLIQESPESVIYLLYHGKRGSPQEIEAFKKDIQERAVCPPELIEAIRSLPRKGHAMSMFSAALLICGMLEGTEDYREDGLNLIAKAPEIAAVVINHHAGWEKSNPSKPELGYVENFTQMLNVPRGNISELEDIFRLFIILHYDHGGGNLSAFVGKAVASGLEDMYGSIASAMCALAGPRHGRANQESLEFVQKVLNDLGQDPQPKEVELYIRNLLENKELIFGFGHAVLRVEDPRATVMYEIANKRYSTHPLIKIANLLRTEGPKVLGENPKISDPYPNVDAISGSLLTAAGFGYPQYFTVLFGLARVIGISIQIAYERCEARNGKGTPIVRPKYLYKPRQ